VLLFAILNSSPCHEQADAECPRDLSQWFSGNIIIIIFISVKTYRSTYNDDIYMYTLETSDHAGQEQQV